MVSDSKFYISEENQHLSSKVRLVFENYLRIIYYSNVESPEQINVGVYIFPSNSYSIEEDSSINVTRSEKIKIFKMKVDFISIIEACYELIINKNDKLIKHQSKLFKNAFLDVYR